MKLPSLNIIKAINLAANLHRHHERQDDNMTPYISHLVAVAMYIQSVTDDESTIIAGLMHDALEDVPDYEYENLVTDCGKAVADLVLTVTENKSLPYKERKLDYIDRVRHAGPATLAISLADKIHNAHSYASMPEEKKHSGHSWLYKEILSIAEDKIKQEEYKFLIPLVQECATAVSII